MIFSWGYFLGETNSLLSHRSVRYQLEADQGLQQVNKGEHLEEVKKKKHKTINALISGGGNGNPFQYSCLENSMDRKAWWATVHGATKRHNWVTNGFNFCVEEWHHFLEYQLYSSMQHSLASHGLWKMTDSYPSEENKRRKQMLIILHLVFEDSRNENG